MQLEAVFSHPVTYDWGEETFLPSMTFFHRVLERDKVSSESFFLQNKHPQLVLVSLVLQILYQLCFTFLDLFQHLNVFVVVKGSKNIQHIMDLGLDLRFLWKTSVYVLQCQLCSCCIDVQDSFWAAIVYIAWHLFPGKLHILVSFASAVLASYWWAMWCRQRGKHPNQLSEV